MPSLVAPGHLERPVPTNHSFTVYVKGASPFQGDDWMEHCKVVEISHTCLYMDVMKVAISWEIRI